MVLGKGKGKSKIDGRREGREKELTRTCTRIGSLCLGYEKGKGSRGRVQGT